MSQEPTEIQGIVEIGQKPVVARNATARGRLNLKSETKAAILVGAISKGNVLEASTIAAIQAVKETPRIIPHCHPIPLEGTKVTWSWEGNDLWCELHVSAPYNTSCAYAQLEERPDRNISNWFAGCACFMAKNFWG